MDKQTIEKLKKSNIEQKRTENRKSYHRQGCNNYTKCTVNAVQVRPNSFLHEVGKLFIGWKLIKEKQKFISEAVRNKRDEKGNERQVDISCLDDGYEYEAETLKHRAERFKDDPNVIVFPLWDKEIKQKTKELETLMEEKWLL